MSHHAAEKEKVIEYLLEAQAVERSSNQMLSAQIAATPRGQFRSALEHHRDQTRGHERKLGQRLDDLGYARPRAQAVLKTAETLVGQSLSLAKLPLSFLRGSSGEDRILRNARELSAAEAQEVSTYTALRRLADAVGDADTAQLALTIAAEEQAMLDRIVKLIPSLTDKVVEAELHGKSTYNLSSTGAGEAARDAGEAITDAAQDAGRAAKRVARQGRKLPGVADLEGQVKGALASAGDLAIARYDDLAADEIASRLSGVSQVDLAKIDAYERRNEKRTTILSRITALRANEPWPGYDDQTADEVRDRVRDADEQLTRTVRDYERAHKARRGVLTLVTRELASV